MPDPSRQSLPMFPAMLSQDGRQAAPQCLKSTYLQRLDPALWSAGFAPISIVGLTVLGGQVRQDEPEHGLLALGDGSSFVQPGELYEGVEGFVFEGGVVESHVGML
jgi:hypothetical protein